MKRFQTGSMIQDLEQFQIWILIGEGYSNSNLFLAVWEYGYVVSFSADGEHACFHSLGLELCTVPFSVHSECTSSCLKLINFP
jgi:hypothetical protein